MKNKAAQISIIGICTWIVAFILALKVGAVDKADSELVMQLRLPRALLAGAVGAALSVSGAVLQAIFANPLCEPYTLGVSAGAAIGAVLAASVGLSFVFGGLALPAFLGALLFTGVLYFIARRPGSTNLTLLLSGVMLGFLGSSLVALWMALADSNGIQSAMLWLMGDLSRARLSGAIFSLLAVSVIFFLIWKKWRELDAMLAGEEGASALGIAVNKSRRTHLVLVSLLIALAVSGAGMIGFVGLVVPHFARRFVGAIHLRLLPVAAIWGAVILTFADILARFLARPYELPVGVVTALFGAPLFLWVIVRKQEIR